MGVPGVVVDKVPDTCWSLSVTRCKEVRLEARADLLKELHLDDCKCICFEELVDAFPGLESLSLDVGSVPCLKHLSFHLTAPAAEELSCMLQRRVRLESLKVTVARQGDVGAAEQILRTAAPLVRVRHDDRYGAKLSMLNARHLQELLCPCSGW
jgi:hypothetical protein